MNKTVIIILVVLVVVLGGFFLFLGGGEETLPEAGKPEKTESPDSGTPPQLGVPAPGFEDVPEAIVVTDGEENKNVVVYAGAGYSPDTLRIKVGDTVVFENETSGNMWIASASHPTHTVYPDSNIAKCSTSEAGSIFDACGGTPTGKSWSFTFDNAGTWKYHDHLSPQHRGTIIVE